jgi:hypothetical protein
LTDKGSQRFSKKWQVCPDPTGLGRYIIITSTVYTDSGYTTKSTTYGIEQHEFLVQDRLNPFVQGGTEVDYKQVRKIVQEELANLPKVEIPKPEKVDLIPIVEGLHAVIDEVRGIKFPEQKETNINLILVKLEVVQRFLNNLTIPDCDHKELTCQATENAKDIRTQLEKIDVVLRGIKIPDVEMGPVTEAIADTKRTLLERLEMMPLDKEKLGREKEQKGRKILSEYLNGA